MTSESAHSADSIPNLSFVKPINPKPNPRLGEPQLAYSPPPPHPSYWKLSIIQLALLSVPLTMYV